MTIKRFFLGWNNELAMSVAEKLLKEAKRSEFIDLSHILTVVSTAHSIKSLSYKLTELANKEGCALLPPKIVTPQYFFYNQANKKVPAEAQRLLFYIEAIRRISPKVSFLFPNTTDEDKNFLWYMDKAEQISTLADTLASVGLTIEDFMSNHLAIIGEDFNRFDELSHIEHAYFQTLAKAGFEDTNKVKIESALNPKLPDGISKVIFIAVSDPIPVVCETINILSSISDLEVWINAPLELECTFDLFGRPNHDYWKIKNLEIADFKDRVTIFDSPSDLSVDFANLIAEKNTSSEPEIKLDGLSIIMPDASLEPSVRRSFLNHNIETYNPSGKKLDEYQPYALFKVLADFIINQDYRSFANLLRNADFLTYAAMKTEGLDYAKLFSTNDEIQNTYMPGSFSELLKAVDSEKKDSINSYSEILSVAQEFLKNAKGDSLAAISIAEEIYSSILSTTSIEVCDVFLEALKAIANAVFEIKETVKLFPELSNNDTTDLLNKKLQNITLFPNQKDGTLPLRGWLELQWEANRPLTFIIGMNEGIVPSITTSDIFLPDSTRKKIGLPCNDSRFARDAYILQSVIHNQNGSQINFVVMKTNQKGEYLKPSRLLLQTQKQEDFHERLNYLFRYDSISFERDKVVQSEYPFKYSVPIKPLKDNRLRVTDFKSYLECPFRFYLKRILGYEGEIDDAKTDIDEAQFGTICHEILKELGDKLNNLDSKELNALLELKLQLSKSKFSSSIPVEFSFYSLQQRLKKALELMIEDREKRQWKALFTEKPFSLILNSKKLSLWFGENVKENFTFIINGKIDRIDFGADGKSLRIIDYKTGNVSETPEKEHYKTVTARTDESLIKEYSSFELNGKQYRWTDLQLPLYAIILSEMEEFKGYTVTDCSYFVIPKAVTDTRIVTWQNIGADELSAAKKCVAGVILNIAKGIFLPPSSKVEYDNYEKLLYSPSYEKYIEVSHI